MSILDLNLENTPELRTVEADEYKVRCHDCEVSMKEETGNKYILMRLDIPKIPESKDIVHVLMLPSSDDSEKQQIRRKNNIKEAAEAFGIDYSGGLDTDNFIGESAWALLSEETDPEYGPQNRVRRFVTQQ